MRPGKGGCPAELSRLRALLTRGLGRSTTDWAELQTVYGWVHRAAAVLENPGGLAGAGVRQQYADLVAEMAAGQDARGTLGSAVAHFGKVTASYEPGLFHCYDIVDLPRTNNDIEQYFGTARHRAQAGDARAGDPRGGAHGRVAGNPRPAVQCGRLTTSGLRPMAAGPGRGGRAP